MTKSKSEKEYEIYYLTLQHKDQRSNKRMSEREKIVKKIEPSWDTSGSRVYCLLHFAVSARDEIPLETVNMYSVIFLPLGISSIKFRQER